VSWYAARRAASCRWSPSAVSRFLSLFSLVLRLVEEGIISQGKGAEVLGMNRVEFLAFMAANGVPAANYGPEELERELAEFGP
jgi:predicted HTH domain antitoxin